MVISPGKADGRLFEAHTELACFFSPWTAVFTRTVTDKPPLFRPEKKDKGVFQVKQLVVDVPVVKFQLSSKGQEFGKLVSATVM